MVSVDAIHKVIDANQLTTDLEGTLEFDNEEWIDLRLVSRSKVTYTYIVGVSPQKVVCTLVWLVTEIFLSCVDILSRMNSHSAVSVY